jgi:asparagine synthase (glutamine-hydrolysing)
MCGFAGVIWKGSSQGPEPLEAMLREFENGLLHRGPDDGATYVQPTFAVLHRRLAIIDIAQGQQPMFADDGRLGIAYNGEVYNYRYLRKHLEQKGYSFNTQSDTEVVLELFREYGPESFASLDGMFAAFIWDTRRNPDGDFFLVRDHLGIKPLYVYEDADRFAFSSELRPLMNLPAANLSINPLGLQSYLTFRYVHAPHTLLDNVRRVEAGTYWKISHGRVFRNRFWDLPIQTPTTTILEAEAGQRLFSLLRDSVKAQQMSEVPIGLLLSGGLDSTVISALCCEIGVQMKSFNIGFPTVNEFAYCKTVAASFGLDHVTIETTPQEIIEHFEKVVIAMDEPSGDAACFPLYMLAKEIKHSVTVVLSGEGSDELLAGYPQYRHVFESEPATCDMEFESFLRHSCYFVDEPPAMKHLLDPARVWQQKSYFVENSLLQGMLAYDLKTWLPENLMMKADKILMSHSLEGRFPFLSKDLVEFLYLLPSQFKLRNNASKVLLRQTFADRLPKAILERPKMGFSVPIELLVMKFKDRIYALIEQLWNTELGEHLDFPEVRRRYDAHYSGLQANPLWVWTVMVLMQWFALRNTR